MKTMTSMYLSTDLLNALQTSAKGAGKSVSAMAEALLRQALNVVPDASQGPSLTKRETLALSGYDRLLEQHRDAEGLLKGAQHFTRQQIARASGLYPSEVLAALRGLEAKGLLVCDELQDMELLMVGKDDAPYVEHWRRAKVAPAAEV